MKMYSIDSRVEIGAHLPEFSEDVVKNEPMLYSATPSFAYENGGPITRAFLYEAFAGTVFTDTACFDSRVHMLMPGWWPCIPGWHHDDVPRTRGDGQPNYETPEYRSKHILALVGGDICPTEFAVGKVDMPHIDDVVYGAWDGIVDQDVAEGSLTKVVAPDRRLIHFNDHSFHRGTQAIGRGWRWFGRLSWDAGYEAGRKHHNEIRRQVNVYMDMPKAGW